MGSEAVSVSSDRLCSESWDGARWMVMKSLMPFWRGCMFFGGRFAWSFLGFLLSLLSSWLSILIRPLCPSFRVSSRSCRSICPGYVFLSRRHVTRQSMFHPIGQPRRLLCFIAQGWGYSKEFTSENIIPVTINGVHFFASIAESIHERRAPSSLFC